MYQRERDVYLFQMVGAEDEVERWLIYKDYVLNL